MWCTAGFPLLLPSLVLAESMVASLGVSRVALEPPPLGTACAAWTGVGTLRTAVLGTASSAEAPEAARLASTVPAAAVIADAARLPRARPPVSPPARPSA